MCKVFLCDLTISKVYLRTREIQSYIQCCHILVLVLNTLLHETDCSVQSLDTITLVVQQNLASFLYSFLACKLLSDSCIVITDSPLDYVSLLALWVILRSRLSIVNITNRILILNELAFGILIEALSVLSIEQINLILCLKLSLGITIATENRKDRLLNL